jgi:hypothetical protein
MGECSKGIATSSGGSENNRRGSCKTHHVGISPQEDCGGTKGTVGQGEGCEEDCLVRKRNHNANRNICFVLCSSPVRNVWMGIL